MGNKAQWGDEKSDYEFFFYRGSDLSGVKRETQAGTGYWRRSVAT